MSGNTQRTNTPTEQNKQDNNLLLYRIEQVEKKTDAVIFKLDNQENIKKSDLIEFRDTIVTRVNEIRDGLQKQIDDVKEEKADKSQVDDLKTRLNAYSAAITSVIIAMAIFFLTKLAASK